MMASGYGELPTASPKDNAPATGQYDERSIEVKGVPLDFSLEAIWLYFENRNRSSGGPIPLEPVRDRTTGVIQITFEFAKDAKNVVKRNIHSSKGLKMEVGMYKPQAVHGEMVFISNVHQTTEDDTLIDFLEAKTQMDVEEVLPGNEVGSFLVYVNGIIDFEKVQEICNQRPLTGNILQMSQLSISSTILLRNVPPQIDREVIEWYFGNRGKSSGGDLCSVKQLPGNIYLVTFENQSDVTAVCNREHTLFGSKLEVTPMESSVISQEEIFERTEIQLQSVLHLQFLVKHKKIVEDQLKFTAQVIWAESQGDKLKLKYKKGSNEETHKILTDLIETVTVEKIDIPEAIFEEVKEEIENMGDNQSVFLDRESHSGIIMGFNKSLVDDIKETVLSDIIKPKYKTEEIDLKQYKIDLLSADDFHIRMENEYSGLKITYPNGKIAFNGYSSQIREVKLNMFQFLDSRITSVTYLPSNVYKIINNPPIRCYLLDKIKEKNYVGSWETTDDVPCYLHSTCDESINEIDAIIKRHLTVLSFNKYNERITHFFKVKSKKWKRFLNKIEREFKDLYYIDEGGRFLITTYDEVSEEIEEKFDDFFKKDIEALPANYSPMSSNQNLLMVEVKGEEYDSVKASFTEGLSPYKVTIQKIERVQNRKLYRQYQVQLELTKLKNQPNIINETQCLWHMAKYKIPDVKEWVSQINEHGFRYNEHKSDGLRGVGMYFGVGGVWSVGRLHGSQQDSSSAFLCSVVTGTCCQGKPGLTHLSSSDGNVPVQCDSAVDDINKPTQYVIFNGEHILPKYLVTYKIID